MIWTNHIARRLQWLLECDEWTPPGTVQGFCVYLQLYVEWTQLRLEEAGIDPKDWDSEGWLECAPDEPQSEGDRRVDSPQAAGPGATSEAGNEQAPPESRMDSLKRSIVQFIHAIRRRFRRAAAQERDAEKGAAGADTNATPDAPGVTDTTPPGVSDAPLVTTTTLGESPQGQDAAQTEHSQLPGATEPRADDSGATRAVAEAGTVADEGRQDEPGSAAMEHADQRQGGDVRPSQEGLTAPYDAPTQLSKSHCEPCSQSQNDG
ncbi:uncharacterized protein B0H18DRAFT_1007340 [Fomitopsis serialis]|uniref:uncharacterized protein n=1 Tax=Fomitopsis serialis TaxID=139415 RepID=UPI00200797FF|nr:uncharacterized protein B0H18DRAFT_1007340 [Neoantrodia serialis]KAH9925993.1 hypothetical protein B0H18DRAFT_1007340 [Neoantrodia serialis]